MTNTKDIKERIELDFGDKASEVHKIFAESFEKADYLKLKRTIRCILFLANRDIGKLQNYIEVAINDPRDVMFWAEYKNHEHINPIRIRDFNNPFDQADKNVIE
jgi:hypothetical protein